MEKKYWVLIFLSLFMLVFSASYACFLGLKTCVNSLPQCWEEGCTSRVYTDSHYCSYHEPENVREREKKYREVRVVETYNTGYVDLLNEAAEKKAIIEARKARRKGSSTYSSSTKTKNSTKKKRIFCDPDDYDSPEDYADDAWGDDFDTWDEAYDYWENW